MDYEAAHLFLIKKLEQELPAYLTYHCVEHTKDVVAAAESISKSEGVDADELELLKTAALFHDSGFLSTYDNHEEASCKIAREHLPGFNYGKVEIDKICELIMVTKLPQNPHNKLESILCDSDLYYLGTNAYFTRAADLYKELKGLGRIKDEEEWQNKQVQFLESHQYFNEKALKKCTIRKAKNLQRLKGLILKKTEQKI